MKKVVFVAPYFMDATERFIRAAGEIADAQIGLVSCDPLSKLKDATKQGLSHHFAVNNITTSELLRGIQEIGHEMGGIDRIIGMLEQIQVPLGEIRDHLAVTGMGAHAANKFRDKAVMKTALQNAGLPCAKHALVSSFDEVLAIASEFGFPLIIKPPDGAGAKGTYRCENIDQLRACLDIVHPSSRQPVVIEEFVTGQEFSFDSICLNGKLVWSSISHYSPGPLEVVQQPWVQWCVMIPRETDQPKYQPIKQIAEKALNTLGMSTGLSHMEWFLKPDGSIAISEVGARPPGAQFTTLISYAHDFNLYSAWPQLLINDRFDVPERRYAAGAAYLRGMGTGRVANVAGLKEVADSLGDIVVEAKIPQSGQAASSSYEGEGYVIVRHPETTVVEKALQKIITNIRVELG